MDAVIHPVQHRPDDPLSSTGPFAPSGVSVIASPIAKSHISWDWLRFRFQRIRKMSSGGK